MRWFEQVADTIPLQKVFFIVEIDERTELRHQYGRVAGVVWCFFIRGFRFHRAVHLSLICIPGVP